VSPALDLRDLLRRLVGAPSPRVGSGFDVHPYGGERPLVLGGVRFHDEAGLAGHSDADVIAHAATDALLGAAGLGDIGSHFPDGDAALAGADSLVLLARAAALVRAAGWRTGNIDCTVVLDAPKIAPHREEMQRRLSAAAGAPVTVKGKRTEGIGALGRREGVACWAVAVVVPS
jgi:2-C-methyl-D-erythritol 2,4-cyclodiphosphate synthase